MTGSVDTPLFKGSIGVTRVAERLEQAAKESGRTAGVAEAKQRLEETEAIRRANVLWIDDNPDNNIDEVLMLRELGLNVAQTRSSRGADRYLQRMRFDLVITDIGRGLTNLEAGVKDIERLRAADPERPVIVYTFDPDERAQRALAAGAAAIVDTPAGLLETVLARFAG